MHNSHTAAASLSALLLLFRSPSSIFVGVNHTWLIAIQKHKDHNQDKTIYIQNTWVFNIHNLFLSFFAATIFLCASHCIASFRFGIIRLLCAHTMNAITLIIMCVVYFIYHFLLCIRRWLVSFFVSLSLNHCADRVINGLFFFYLSNFFTNPPCFAAIIIHKRKIDDSKMVFFFGQIHYMQFGLLFGYEHVRAAFILIKFAWYGFIYGIFHLHDKYEPLTSDFKLIGCCCGDRGANEEHDECDNWSSSIGSCLCLAILSSSASSSSAFRFRCCFCWRWCWLWWCDCGLCCCVCDRCSTNLMKQTNKIEISIKLVYTAFSLRWDFAFEFSASSYQEKWSRFGSKENAMQFK